MQISKQKRFSYGGVREVTYLRSLRPPELSLYYESKRQNWQKTKVVGSGHEMFKFVRKHSQPIGDHPPTNTLLKAHSMEGQTFETDRGPPTLAVSPAVSNFVRRSYEKIVFDISIQRCSCVLDFHCFLI